MRSATTERELNSDDEAWPPAGVPSPTRVAADLSLGIARAAVAGGFFAFDIEALQAVVPWALFVVDAQAVIVAASRKAMGLLRAGGGIEERAGRVHIERATVNRRLRDSLEAATGLAATPVNELIGAPDRRGRTRIVLKATRFPVPGPTPLVLLSAADLHDQGSVDRTAVAGLFGLSDREAELAEHFSHGLRVDEIAEAMGVATNTARVHLRNVFSKTGCSSQVELARLFAIVP